MKNKYDVFSDGEPKTKRYNSDFNEVLSSQPVWLIHKGTYIFYTIIILFIISIGLIKFPVTTQGKIMISDKLSTDIIFISTSNDMEKLFIRNGEYIKANTVVGMIKNEADYIDVQKLYEIVNNAELYLKTKDQNLLNIDFDSLFVGDLKDSYTRFIYATKRLRTFKDIPSLNKNMTIQEKIELIKKESVLNQIKTHKNLHHIESDIIYNNILEYLEVELELSYFNLKMDLLYWERKFLIKNKREGTFFFSPAIDTENSVCYVVTPGERELVGDLILKDHNDSTILQKNQQIKIQLKNYPITKYGYIIGKVKNILYVPEENGLAVEIDISYPMKSTTNKYIPFYSHLTGDTEIVLKEESLLMRILDPVKSVFNNLSSD